MRRLLITGLLILAAAGCNNDDPASPVVPPAPPPPPPPPTAVTVAVSDNVFVPATVQVTVGQSVRWNNNGNFTHTVTADGGAFSSGNVLAGAAFTHTFAAAGSFPYHCALHPGMVGVVEVNAAVP